MENGTQGWGPILIGHSGVISSTHNNRCKVYLSSATWALVMYKRICIATKGLLIYFQEQFESFKAQTVKDLWY